MRGSWTSASVSRPICPSNTAAWWFHTVMLQKLFTEIYFWGHLRRETNALWRPVSRLMSCSTAANEDDYWETWRRQILEQFVTSKKKKKHVLSDLMFLCSCFLCLQSESGDIAVPDWLRRRGGPSHACIVSVFLTLHPLHLLFSSSQRGSQHC